MMLQGELLRGEPAPQWRPFFQGVRLYQTTDGGVNWTQVYTNMPADSGLGDSLPYSGLKTGLTPINMQEAWVSGRSLTVGDFFLYHTIDGGRTWSPSDYKLFFTEERFHVHPPEFFDSKNGILPFEAGSEGASLYFSRTADGGKTWTTGAAVSGTSFFSVVSPNDIFAWPDQFLVSHDSGQTWTRVVPNVDLLIGMIQFQFVDTQTGWVVTKDANNKTLLYKSVDGGHTWIAQN
jgi:photosystem II stability/assembly factor-like uncharacterized protein